MENNQIQNNVNDNSVQLVQPVSPVTQNQTVTPAQQPAPQPVQPVEQKTVQPVPNNTKNEKQVFDTKYKNPDAFNNKEKVLFEIEPEKESNPLGTLIIFAVLIVGLLFLPLADKLINRNKTNIYTPIHNQAGEIINNNGLDNMFYFDTEQVSAGIGGLELKNFVTEETTTGYKINFTVINSNEEAFLFNKKYYMDFYEGETLLYHALIHSYKPIAAKAATEMSLEISEKAYVRADSIKLVETKPELYPAYEFDTKEGEFETLTCIYGKSVTTYYFKDNMLKKIRETYNNKEYTSEGYQKDKSQKQSEIKRYQGVAGMNANFVETDTEFTAQLDFSLADVQASTLSTLQVYRFFKYHEQARVVAYEMPAMGYTCS